MSQFPVSVNLTLLWKGCKHCEKIPLFISPVTDLKGRVPMEASQHSSSHIILWRNATAGGTYTWSAEATKTVSSCPQSFYLPAIISGNLQGKAEIRISSTLETTPEWICASRVHNVNYIKKKSLYLSFVKACSTNNYIFLQAVYLINFASCRNWSQRP
jgi:hypothetical protein